LPVIVHGLTEARCQSTAADRTLLRCAQDGLTERLDGELVCHSNRRMALRGCLQIHFHGLRSRSVRSSTAACDESDGVIIQDPFSDKEIATRWVGFFSSCAFVPQGRTWVVSTTADRNDRSGVYRRLLR